MGADVEVRTSTGWHRGSVSRVKIVMDRPMLRTITVSCPVDPPQREYVDGMSMKRKHSSVDVILDRYPEKNLLEDMRIVSP